MMLFSEWPDWSTSTCFLKFLARLCRNPKQSFVNNNGVLLFASHIHVKPDTFLSLRAIFLQ